MTSETPLLAKIRLAVSKHGARLFRNQVGHYVLADKNCRHCQALNRRLTSGLCPGSADLIGWQSIVITPEMVGKRVAVFLSIEGKSLVGVVSMGQRRWWDAVRAAGGVAGVVRTVDEALELLDL